MFRRAGILTHYAYVRKSNYLLPEMVVPLLQDAVAGRSFVDPEIAVRVEEVQQKDEQCDDENLCTDDSCSVLNECAHLPNALPCDDGSFCNGADTCAGGSCSIHPGDPCAAESWLGSEID